jgi:hypothetical protein
MMDDRFGKVVWGKNGTRTLVKSATAIQIIDRYFK